MRPDVAMVFATPSGSPSDGLILASCSSAFAILSNNDIKSSFVLTASYCPTNNGHVTQFPDAFFITTTRLSKRSLLFSAFGFTAVSNELFMKLALVEIAMKSFFAADAKLFRYHPFTIISEDDYQMYMALVLRDKSQAKPAEPKKKRRRQSAKSSREEPSYSKSDIGKTTPTKTKEYDEENDLQPVFKSANVSVSSNTNLTGGQSPKIIVGVSTLLILLLLVNTYLLHRVYQLEKFATYERKNNCVPKNLPITDENWYKLLQTQRHAHELEVKRLKDVIGGTVILIKQVETSMKDLYEELDKSFQEDLNSSPT